MSELALLITTGVVAAIAGFAIGANDAANSVADAVASRTMTVRQAMIWCAFMEALGTITLGASVSATISKGIVDSSIFMTDPSVYMVMMLAALTGSAVWLVAATLFGLPVSTTHSIVGALVSLGLIQGKGFKYINVDKLVMIVISWVASPLLGALIAVFLYGILYFIVLRPRPRPLEGVPGVEIDTPERRSYLTMPAVCGLTLGVIAFFIVHESVYAEAIPLGWQIAIIGMIFVLVTALGYGLFVPWYRRRYYESSEEACAADRARTLHLAEMGASPITPAFARTPSVASLLGAHSSSSSEIPISAAASVPELSTEPAPVTPAEVSSALRESQLAESEDDVPGASSISPAPPFDFTDAAPRMDVDDTGHATLAVPEERRGFFDSWSGVNRPFILPQALASVLCAFAHGSNDSANAAGLFAGAWAAYHGNLQAETSPEFWIMAVTAVCLGGGVLMVGHKVVGTISKLTQITPVAATATSLSTVLTVLIASALSIPVSSSHILTGSVLGVGIVTQGWRNVSWRLMGRIGLSWLATIPAAMGIAAAIYYLAMAIMGRL